MSLTFRNVDTDPTSPVESWPYEAIVTAIERGTIGDWVTLTAAIDREPWGEVARQVADYLAYARPWGVAPLLERAIARSREAVEQSEREEVATEVARLVDRSGLTVAEFAARIGTSRPRLSTYRSGSVMPSAAVMVRMRRLVDRLTPARAGSGRSAAP